MTRDNTFFEDSYVEYEFFQRDGQCQSPFVGETQDENDTYTIMERDVNESTRNSKEDIISYINREGNIEPKDNEDNSNAFLEERNLNPNEEQAQEPQDATNFEYEEEEMSDAEIEKGLAWNKKYSNEEAMLPKFDLKNKLKLSEAMEKVLEEKVIPTLEIANKKIPDGAPEQDVINGYISYSFHCIIEETKKAVGTNRRSHTIYRSKHESELDLKKKSRDAGSRIVACIEEISELRKQDLEAGVLNNREEEEIDKICLKAELLSSKMKRHLFNTEHLSRETIKQKINEIIDMGSQTNIMQYIEHASEEIDVIEERKRKAFTRKVRDLFSISPKRAMRYYIDQQDTPNCTIPIEQIRKELASRWVQEDFEGEMDDNEEKWKQRYSLNDEDKKYMIENLQNEETFKDAIKSRDIASAHGPDGIGYWALMLAPEQGAIFMSMISKLMLRFKLMPSTWNHSKTILIYKHGSPNEVNNWRPLNIAPCLYRVWSCALANTIQSINRRNRIFHPHQKGFISGVDGCMEHSNMINEIIHDANRSRRNLYICSIDLKDAFGSIPHGYILHTLNQMNFPQEIQEIIEDSYCRSEARIYMEGKVSKSFEIKRGVKQGCPVSPLLFNLCLNPLLTEVELAHEGYRLDEDTKITIQAYADDIVLFSETREEMNDILQTVQEFFNYSKLQVNVNKCKMMSYILADGKRYFDEENFTLGNQQIPNATLADNIRYLGTDVSTAETIRVKGTEHCIKSVETLIDKIDNSVLSLSQKIYAIRTFAIPKLDYLLTNGRVSLNKMNSIDMRIRSLINKHVKGVHLPKNIFYTHWKDGGFSLQSLHKRTLALRVKTFMTLFNSKCETVNNAMYFFVESERIYRNIETTSNPSNRDKETFFLDWVIPKEMNKGTDTIVIHALRAAEKLKIKLLYDGATCNISAEIREIKAIGNTNATMQTSKIFKTPYGMVRQIMKNLRKTQREGLIANKGVGHSFINIRDCGFANSFIGNYRSNLNDTISSWIIKARCNMLRTGTKCLKMNIPKDKCVKCPFCGGVEIDTLQHRLNGCKCNRNLQTKRHNNIQNIVLSYMQKRLNKGMHITTNKTVNVDGIRINEEFSSMKPDIVAWSKDKVIIVEFSVPYDNISRNGNKIDIVYNEKVKKYKGLVEACKKAYNREVKQYTIIVSSLGAINKNSINDIKKLLNITEYEKKTMKTILRRLSLAACVGSYFIFNNLKFKPFEVDPEVTSIEQETVEIEPVAQHRRNEEDRQEEEINEDDSNDEEEKAEDRDSEVYIVSDENQVSEVYNGSETDQNGSDFSTSNGNPI